ncbi:LysM peptidoglycan-binding domain-containing protein [Candidatus Woesebacteria bacterium]|nr:LysM peptidoglycan-binding domain-containing protein [Candidatus Woesebacteria bacterium]
MLIGYRFARLYITRNGGSSWSEAQPAGNIDRDWYSVSVSGDGQRIIAIPTNGRLYVSMDNGASWGETQPAGDGNKNWIATDITKNGENYLAGISLGRMYLGRYVEPTSTPASMAPATEHISDGKAPDTSCRSSVPTSKPDLFQIDVYGTDATLYFAPVTNANKYVIAYGDGDTTEQYGDEYNSGNVDGVLSYTIHMLTPSSSYSFKVRGGNGCMPGEWSNVMKVKIGAPTRGKVIYYKNLTSLALSSLMVSPGSNNTVLGAKTTQGKNCKSYTVQAGDSLWGIAKNEIGDGSKYSTLMTDNNLSSTLLRVGQKIKIGCK